VKKYYKCVDVAKDLRSPKIGDFLRGEILHGTSYFIGGEILRGENDQAWSIGTISTVKRHAEFFYCLIKKPGRFLRIEVLRQ
jgi:hypothetical protein